MHYRLRNLPRISPESAYPWCLLHPSRLLYLEREDHEPGPRGEDQAAPAGTHGLSRYFYERGGSGEPTGNAMINGTGRKAA